MARASEVRKRCEALTNAIEECKKEFKAIRPQ
jgi:hypothetical protein